ncbi:hypothetical protein JCGZ_19012 [Jatropha curcas]|uniref:UBC core domain-containing protein n=1 Tax=Jatropha curcas TaxID=180498 RepID=A0A067JVL6_JATCU|nr:hypothetical protein JCGZ_19012 [Jatropha curcas]
MARELKGGYLLILQFFQVLVSLQGLVLNEKPYYNEPETPPAHNWKLYNNYVFILSCKTMLFNLQIPPKAFDGFVYLFFRDRASTILKACCDYMNDKADVGYILEDNAFKITELEKSIFKEKLNMIYKKLEEAFDRNRIGKLRQPDDVIKENKILEFQSKPTEAN